jgi:hypothetical protein
MPDYAVYIHLDLLEAVPSRGEQRKAVMNFIRSLASSPRTSGDFTDQDQSLRTRQIKIIGHYAITYWVDEAVKAVMVVAIRPADR